MKTSSWLNCQKNLESEEREWLLLITEQRKEDRKRREWIMTNLKAIQFSEMILGNISDERFVHEEKNGMN
jgi:hypothetical protein